MIGSDYYSEKLRRKEISPQLCGTFLAAPADSLPQDFAGFIRDIEENAVALSPTVEDMPPAVQLKAAFLAVIWIAGAAIVAGIVVLLAKLREIC